MRSTSSGSVTLRAVLRALRRDRDSRIFVAVAEKAVPGCLRALAPSARPRISNPPWAAGATMRPSSVIVETTVKEQPQHDRRHAADGEHGGQRRCLGLWMPLPPWPPKASDGMESAAVAADCCRSLTILLPAAGATLRDALLAGRISFCIVVLTGAGGVAAAATHRRSGRRAEHACVASEDRPSLSAAPDRTGRKTGRRRIGFTPEERSRRACRRRLALRPARRLDAGFCV